MSPVRRAGLGWDAGEHIVHIHTARQRNLRPLRHPDSNQITASIAPLTGTASENGQPNLGLKLV
jgi:hypothetical protein